MTYNTYKKHLKTSKPNYCLATALRHNPQIRGRVVRIVIRTPKKPNSALRKTGKVFLRTRKIVYAKVAGSGYLPSKFSVILVRGSGFKDTPAINYTIIRGAWECLPVLSKTRRRSIYGRTGPAFLKIKSLKK